MKNLSLSIILVLLGSLQISGQDFSVKDLRCDYQAAPLGIDNPEPCFSWRLHAGESSDISQKSYQVLVASSEDLLKSAKADIWNSGVVQSGSSLNIPYEGKPLESGKRYYWKVGVESNRGGPAQFSKASYFETSLLRAGDWKAKWIAAPSIWNWREFLGKRKTGEEGLPPWDNHAPMFRKEFSCPGEILSARMYVSGLGLYEAYLNGKKVGDHRLDPAFTRYDKSILYETYDVTGLLDDNNAAGLLVGNGWFNMPTKTVWAFDYAPWRGKPRAIMQIEILYADGTSETIVTDESWSAAPAPVKSNSLMEGMLYDARLEQPGWCSAGFDSKDWLPVYIVPSPGGIMRSQIMDPIRPFQELEPVTILKHENGDYLVDFGQNMAGWARITARGAAGDILTLRYAEGLKDGRVDQSNVKRFIQEDMVQTDRFIFRDQEETEFETKFTYHGFQYIEVSGYSGELTSDRITALAVSTDFQERGRFSCSSDLVNQLQHNTLWSFRSNYFGYPTDCPQREKNGWTGDAQIAVETGLWNFHSGAAYEKYIQDMADEMRPDGNMAAIIPTSQWGYQGSYGGPDWIGAYIILPWQLYQYDGNMQVLETHYEGMKRMHGWFEAHTENHILSMGLGDWAPFESKTPVPLTSTAYYYHFTQILEQTAILLGRADDAGSYSGLAGHIRSAFNREFYDEKTGRYGEGTQTAQSAALYFGLVNEKEKKKALKVLTENIRSRDYHIDTGILGAKFLLHALAMNGYPDMAYKILTNETCPGWGYWIGQGATTLWEHWDGRDSKAHASFNHIMYGDISNFFFRYILGIRPDPASPGFRHFYVDPKLSGELKHSKGSFESEYGTIHVDWENGDRGFRLLVEIPGNTRATVLLPGKDILVNGKKLKEMDKESVSRSGKATGITLGSGNYTITSRVNPFIAKK